MTVTTFVSIKGAPGVTTLACLVGATWPEARTVAVVEADPFGGDLAVRFQLSSAWGWSSYVTAARRSQGVVPIDPHLQALPGGLDAMVLPAGNQRVVAGPSVEALLRASVSSDSETRDLLVDGGRLPVPLTDPTEGTAMGVWLERSDRVVVVTRRDPASLFKVREQAATLRERCGDRLALAVVGPGIHGRHAIGEFTGLPVVVAVPYDVRAAQIACGERVGVRALSRSQLLVSARRLALTLSDTQPDGEHEPGGRDTFAEANGIDIEGPGTGGRVARMLRGALHRSVRDRAATGGGGEPRSTGVPTEGELGPPPSETSAADQGPRPLLRPAGEPDEVPIQAVTW